MIGIPKRYLLWFAHEHVDFRIAEIESICEMYDIKVTTILRPDEYPYWIIESDSEDAVKKIASRSISLRSCIELWGDGGSHEDLHRSLKEYPQENMRLHLNNEKSFKVIVETFCKHFSQDEKIKKIESFSYLPIEGPVNLRNPDTALMYIEYYGLDPNTIPDKPYHLFFGRLVADGQRQLIRKLSLKTRNFIGNTSMDPQLSLIMANQAQVKNGDLILDPFVGSGSLLVAASQFGGYTLGTDIDYLMLHARTRPSRISQKTRGKDESIASNMKQYGTSSYYIDVLVTDFSLPVWRSDMRVDAIITDPPYGIREATERVGTIKRQPVIDQHQVASHIPSKIDYGLPQMFVDLLSFAANHLCINGRLVCWFPLFREHYADEQLPSHPCLQLIANSEQILSTYTSRRLLTYKKIRDPQDDDPIDDSNVLDFRVRYFGHGDETRKERRMKRAEQRAKNKENWEKNIKSKTAR
ncbi:tRNA (guanine(10)-N2)-methyltransferase homolog [Neodiprion fabricii]|uniref:tRNA (guanine(10)-N2)-methyltransferase homolog n=1 Tax=Neodiprion fabricii TaxID=2872261 RepID=UPI001ED98508|nr:tRNA (guanine(10)-N2)-methyltransferase homolog [Neodiprion fabricii]